MYYFFLLGKFLALILPRRLLYPFAFFIARLKLFLSPRDRENLIENLLPIVKDKLIAKKYAYRITENFAYYLVDFFGFTRINAYFIKKYVKIEGEKYLYDLVSRDRRVILLAAHLGNYELGAAIISKLGYRLSVVALSHRDEKINNFFNVQRNLSGVEVIPTGSQIKNCFRALDEKRLLALLGDRNFSGKGKKVKMFGRACFLPRGAAFFARKTKSHIVPVFLIRENKRFYRLIFGTAVSPYDNEKIKTEDAIIKECAVILERCISQYPDQWYMFEKYWVD